MKKIIGIISMIFAISAVLWMGIIFLLSAENAQESNFRSEEFTQEFEPYMDYVYDIEEKTEGFLGMDIIGSYELFVRKLAHVAVYAVLGFLSVIGMRIFTPSLFVRALATSNLCLVFAVIDEMHQVYVPGRSSSVRDVCFDYIGSLGGVFVGVLVILFIGFVFKKRKKVADI